MNTRWRLKAYSLLFLILLSVYLLIPSVFDFRGIRQLAEEQGDQPPWYVRLFPDKQINLGLDLRGGIYLELEVSLHEALVQRSQIVAGEIERFLRDEKIPYQKVGVLPKTTTIAVFLQNPDDLVKLQNHIRDFYGSAFKEIKASPVLTYRIPGVDDGTKQGLFQEVLQWAQGDASVLDVQLQPDSLEVVLAKPEAGDAVSQAIQQRFSGRLEAVQAPAPLYLTQTDVYQNRLKEETAKQAVETIRNRIDRHGVAEPSIQRSGENRVVIELPGVRDPDRAIALVKKAGKLEFKLVDESIPDAQVRALVDQTRAENNIPEGYTLKIVEQINEALKGKIPAESEISYEVQYDPIGKKIVGGTPYLLKSKVELSGDMLKNTQVSVQNNEPNVSLSFNPTGTKIFAELTAANVGKRLAILLDGTVNKAPVIKTAIPSGEAQITLGYGDYQALVREAEDLVVVLREGALPATLTEVTKTVIGPSLGKSSIQRGFEATLLSAAVVMVFMGAWYRWSGILADLALILNVVFIFAALTLFGATLTLPGLAGVVLTIGMAVDANIIILERIKEELVLGRTAKAAVDDGYTNAMNAVVDANITTFLSGVVLYQFGTGPIRGFAVTLIIGIISTMYTVIIGTWLVYDYLFIRRKMTRMSL